MAYKDDLDFLSKAVLNFHIENQSIKNIKIYQDNYFYSLLEILHEKYPVIKAALSENNFNFFAKNYIAKTQSTSENINDFGNSFPKFLSTRNELRSISYIDQLAQIDLLYFNSFVEQKNPLKTFLGVLELWNDYKNPSKNFENTIDENQFAHILKIIEGNEIKLIAKKVQ